MLIVSGVVGFFPQAMFALFGLWLVAVSVALMRPGIQPQES